MTGAVAKRYARALFSLAVESGTPSFEDVGAELGRLTALFRDAGLAAVLGAGAFDAEARAALIERVVTEGGLSTTVGNFLRVLADNGRLGEMDSIEGEYRRLVDRKLGRVRARVISARSLDESDVSSIARAFETTVGGTVLAEVEVDPELVGGVVVEIQGKVYDGSVKRQLERMKAELAGDG